MSLEYQVPYSAPSVGKYAWGCRRLNYSPLVAHVPFPDSFRSLRLEVDRLVDDQGSYRGFVVFCDIYGGEYRTKTKKYDNPEDCILATEALADAVLAAQDVPTWAEEALEAGWSPPRPALQAQYDLLHRPRPAKLKKAPESP